MDEEVSKVSVAARWPGTVAEAVERLLTTLTSEEKRRIARMDESEGKR